jgi:hypothetical protein
MLAVFPVLYPDEDYRSIVYRYHKISGNKNISITNRELFGRRSYKFTIFPRNLKVLFDQIPDNAISIDDFLFNHTFFYWVKPFIPEDRLDAINEEIMKNKGQSSITILLGKGKERFISEDVRYCPECLKNDHQNYGEVYPHRIHQLTFLSFCPEHGYELLTHCPNCEKKLTSLDEGQFLVSLHCECGCILSELKKEPDSLKYQSEKQILDNFYQLVKYCRVLSRQEIFFKIRNILGIKGYLKYSGKIDRKQFFHDFIHYLFRNNLREYITINLRSQIGSDCFFVTSRSVKNNLSYILLIMFLSESVENFISDTPAFSIPIPFGNGPWICGNPVCEGYQLGVIKKCVRVDHGGKYVSGLFGCPLCGFSYSRRWKMGDSNYDKPYAVLTMGPLWYSTLLDLHSKGVSNNNIAKELKTTPTHIGRALKKLREPSSDTRILQSLNMLWSSLDANNEVASTSEFSKQLSKNRKKILAIINENNGISITRTQIAKRIGHLYHKMLKEDREWMEQVLPPSKRNQIVKDWSKLDDNYCELIATAADELYRLNPSEQIKKYTILRRLPKTVMGHLENSPAKLPRSIEMLKSRAEPKKQYLIRHLPVIIKQMRKYKKKVDSLDSIKRFSPMYRNTTKELDEKLNHQLKIHLHNAEI